MKPVISTAKQRPKAAVVFTAVYLMAVAASLALLLLAGKGDSLAGIYLVLVTFPWSSLLMWLGQALQIDSMLFNTLFLLAGGLVNGFIIYRATSFIARRFCGMRAD